MTVCCSREKSNPELAQTLIADGFEDEMREQLTPTASCRRSIEPGNREDVVRALLKGKTD